MSWRQYVVKYMCYEYSSKPMTCLLIILMSIVVRHIHKLKWEKCNIFSSQQSRKFKSLNGLTYIYFLNISLVSVLMLLILNRALNWLVTLLLLENVYFWMDRSHKTQNVSIAQQRAMVNLSHCRYFLNPMWT